MMKILVCIKQEPETTEIRIDPVTKTLIREGVPAIMNPDDKGGLEFALRLKDRFGAEVTVVTMGIPAAEIILREAFAMGADRAILLTDRKLGGADTLATSKQLAGVARQLEWDLIIAGRQAIDGDTAQVGPEISEHLGIPQITYVAGLEYNPATQVYTVTRETEDGHQVLEFKGKALLTCLSSAVKPRYMSVGGIVDAYGKEVEVWGADRLGLPDEELGLKGSPTKVVKSFTKELKAPGQIHEVDPEAAVELIVAKLKEKHII